MYAQLFLASVEAEINHSPKPRSNTISPTRFLHMAITRDDFWHEKEVPSQNKLGAII